MLDFKPSNVVLQAEESRREGSRTRVRVIDFDDSWIANLPPRYWRAGQWMMLVIMYIVTEGGVCGRAVRELSRKLTDEEVEIALKNLDFLFLAAWYLFKPRDKSKSKVRYTEGFLQRLCERLKGPGTNAEVLLGMKDADPDMYDIMEIKSVHNSYEIKTVSTALEKPTPDLLCAECITDVIRLK